MIPGRTSVPIPVVEFVEEGEIRFGPPYYSVKIDGTVISNLYCGKPHLLSPEKELLIVQEWLTTDEKKSPLTLLTAINLINRKIKQITKPIDGWIVPLKFEDSKLIFTKQLSVTPGTIKEYETDIRSLMAPQK